MLPQVSWLRRHFFDSKRSADKRGFKWRLSRAVFDRLVVRPCYYCGAPPETRVLRVWQSGKGCRSVVTIEAYHGLDRKDPVRGYERGNVVSCCSKCNKIKGSFDFEDFLNQVKSIYRHLWGD